MQYKSTRKVIESHLALRKAGDLEKDLQANYSKDIVLIDSHTVYKGFNGMRKSAKELAKSVPEAAFRYRRIRVAKNVGYLVWSARGKGIIVEEGVDTFVVEEGKITVQTVFYRTQPIRR